MSRVRIARSTGWFGPSERPSGREEKTITYDRVLFEFAGPVPSYTVRYVPEIVGPGQRAAVRLGGRAFQEVVFHPAATRDGGGFSAPRGSDSVGGTRALVQYCLAGDHAGYVSFGLGIDKRAPFRVMELSNPPRVAIDIAE